jgi:aminopeptidase N
MKLIDRIFISVLLLTASVYSFLLEEEPNEFPSHKIFESVHEDTRQTNRIEKADDINDWPNYRLPNDSLPIRYDLWLKTDVDKEDFNFSGQVRIHLKVIEVTQLITLNYREITIDNVDLLNIDGSLREGNLDFDYNEELEFVEISLPTIEFPDAEMILDITYQGVLRTDFRGFYRTSYVNSNDERVWFAKIKFESTEARHAMPCYDEPKFRAITGLKIQHDKRFKAVSNMPVVDVDPFIGTDYVTTTFNDSLLMTSSFLTLVVSDYSYISSRDSDTELRVYASSKAIEAGHANYTLSVANPILKKLQEHFGVEFPSSKFDFVSVLGSYLYDPENDYESVKTAIVESVTREYLNCIFGGVVMPQWWAYVWLIKGFETFYSYYIPFLTFNDSSYMDRFQYEVSSAFLMDMDSDVKPLNYYVDTPYDIGQKFDFISRSKAASVIRMFQEALTVPTFTKGLTNYLKTMSHSSATPQNLHESMQKAFDDDFPGNGVNLDLMMSSWEDQPGFPIVNVTKLGDRFIITQERYGGGDEIYSIPLSFTTSSQMDFGIKTPKLWMTKASIDVQSSDSWMIVNIHGSGYYHVSYHTSVWNGLVLQLVKNHERISQYHRIEMFREMTSNLIDESVSISYGLDMMRYLIRERDSEVWDQVAGLELEYSKELFGTSVFPKYLEYLASLVKPHMNRLGYQSAQGESVEDANLRKTLIKLSCKAHQKECFDFQRAELAKFVESGEGSPNVCDGLRSADGALHSKMLDQLVNDEDFKGKTSYIYNLGCPLDRKLIENYLKVLIHPDTPLYGFDIAMGFRETVKKSVLAFETTMDFIQEHFIEIEHL